MRKIDSPFVKNWFCIAGDVEYLKQSYVGHNNKFWFDLAFSELVFEDEENINKLISRVVFVENLLERGNNDKLK